MDIQTRISGECILSNEVYPDLFSKERRFKKVSEVSKEEMTALIGSLRIGNKYLVQIRGKYYYQCDNITFQCEKV